MYGATGSGGLRNAAVAVQKLADGSMDSFSGTWTLRICDNHRGSTWPSISGIQKIMKTLVMGFAHLHVHVRVFDVNLNVLRINR